MKKVILPILICCLLLTGCGVHWSYVSAIKGINNEYFETKVLLEDDNCMIIQNEVTGECFLVIGGMYGITVTPISVDMRAPEEREGYLMSDDANASSDSMSEGVEGN